MIHRFKQKDEFIVLDVGSGAVHLVDELVYNMLDMMDEKSVLIGYNKEAFSALRDKYDEEQIAEAYKEIESLVKEGSLFSSDDYSKYQSKMENSPIKAMCLHVAHDCNLRCDYCFASTGDFEGTRSLMPKEIGKKAIDFLIENSGTRKNLELDFFGGEPLMNFDMVKSTVDYARAKEKESGKNFRFTITTNGVLLSDEIIDYINKEMSNIVLSIDGRKEVNDKMRKTINQKGSYDIIIPKFQKLVSKRGDKQYYVRGTFTRENLDFAEDVLHLHELGFKQISVEPVVGDETSDYSIRESDLPAVYSEYERLADIMLEFEKKGDRFNFFHFMMDLSGGPCAIKRLRGCGCGNEYVAITPEGDIYPCHQFVGHDEWKMGNLNEGTLNLAMKDDFSKTNIYTKEYCGNCWAKFYCSGGCAANSMQYAGSIKKPHKLSCDLEKKRVETAITLMAKRSRLNS